MNERAPRWWLIVLLPICALIAGVWPAAAVAILTACFAVFLGYGVFLALRWLFFPRRRN